MTPEDLTDLLDDLKELQTDLEFELMNMGRNWEPARLIGCVGRLAGITGRLLQLIPTGEPTAVERDPRFDPRPGDVIGRTIRGIRSTRKVLNRNGNEVVYEQAGRLRQNWLTSWVDWSRRADIETRGE